MSINAETKGRLSRIAIYLFYDDAGVVDPYITVALRAFRAHVDRLVVICNGAPNGEGMTLLKAESDDVRVRVNVGFDVWAYKETLESLGREVVGRYDELIFFNYTFFAPIFPLSEMFDVMGGRRCDFWGITAHKELRPNPMTGSAVLPFHIQSHFIAIRAPMLQDDAFWRYWSEMPMIHSYIDSINQHETRFTPHFEQLGYRCSVYMEPEIFDTEHPLLIEIDRTVEKRCPILKRRAFFHDPLYMESEAIDLRRALDLVREKSDYDVRLIFDNLLRTVDLRTVYTNLELLDIFNGTRKAADRAAWSFGAVAVVAHVYYLDLLDEMLAYADNIPCDYDVHITTDTDEKKRAIEHRMKDFKRGTTHVEKVASNLGRDTAALLIAQREVVLGGRYGLICRIHSKKSPQDGPVRAASFKRHLLENLLDSPGYVANLFDIFEDDPQVGMVLPPVVHIGYPTLGHAWFLNEPRVAALADAMRITVKRDTHTPLAAYGSMYWFRPAALRPLFEHPWKWDDFDEPVYGDTDLPHAVERLVTYCAQSQGYAIRCAFTARQAARNYTKLEYKLQLLASCFRSGDIRMQIMQMMYGLPQPTNGSDADPVGVRASFSRLVKAVGRSVRHRTSRLVGSVS